jgi:xanthine dehydrogenase accessory factor
VLVTFGYSDDDAFAVGLTCGGTLHVFIEELDRPGLFDLLATELRADRPVALATVVDGRGVGRELLLRPGAGPEGSLGSEDLDRVAARDALAELEAGRSGLRHYGPAGEARQDDVTVFVESFARRPRMIIFGAVDFTAALVRVAKVLGYWVIVCDARETFATPRRFPSADEVVVDWPHRFLERVGPGLTGSDAVVVLTHDHKFDIPAVTAALGTGVGYLGAMGSRRTTDDRRRRLVESGVTEAALDRLHAPIGLDIGARTPEETAVSICAEIVATRTGRPAQPLRSGDGPIHAPR